MDKQRELFEALADYEPAEFERVPGSLIYIIEVPAHRYTRVMAPIAKDRFVDISARDFFSEELAARTLEFVLYRAALLDLNADIQILTSFNCPGFKFDSVGLLGIDAAKYNLADYLTGKTCIAFPMYRCELRGDESAELIDIIRHEGLCTLDWQRLPYPRISMEFRTSNWQSEHWGLGSVELALRVIKVMVGDEGSYLKLANFQSEILSMRWSKLAFDVVVKHGSYRCDYNTVAGLLEQFAVGRAYHVQ